MDWEMICSDGDLARLIVQHEGCAAVAVDTEFMRRNTFYPQVALLQLCFSDTAWLIDPLAIEDLEPLRRLFRDPGIVKVLHSASEDLEVFERWLGVQPAPLFDTQKAAALLDMGFGLGYRALVHEICAIDLPKGETRSDWLQRPLTASQCEYAAQDVAHLLPVWAVLHERCIAEGKLQWVLEDGAAATTQLATGNGAYHRKIKNAWKLPPRQLAALAAVSEWREQTARERDKPRSWIIDDKACLALAASGAASLPQLAQLELPQPALRRYGKDWLQLLAEVEQVPESELPPPLPGPLDGQQRSLLKKLKKHAREIAAQLEVAPESLLPSRDFELLVRERCGEPIETPPLWQGWRGSEAVEPLRRFLSGVR